MTVIAAVLRSGLVWEDFVEPHIISVHAVARGSANDWRAGSEVADQSCYRDVDHVVAESSAIRPAARNDAAAESALNPADQRVAPEDAQPRETGIIGICRVGRPAACQPAPGGR